MVIGRRRIYGLSCKPSIRPVSAFDPPPAPETEVAIVLRADSSARFALTKGAANAKPPAPESIKHWPLIGVRLGIVICAATRGTLPRTSKGKRCPAHRA